MAASRSGLDFVSCDEFTADAVILDTVRRFKGLERPAVILVIAASDMTGPELAYVGMSRPRAFLAVVSTAADAAWLKPVAQG